MYFEYSVFYTWPEITGLKIAFTSHSYFSYWKSHNYIYDLMPLKWKNWTSIFDIWEFKDDKNATERAEKMCASSHQSVISDKVFFF